MICSTSLMRPEPPWTRWIPGCLSTQLEQMEPSGGSDGDWIAFLNGRSVQQGRLGIPEHFRVTCSPGCLEARDFVLPVCGNLYLSE